MLFSVLPGTVLRPLGVLLPFRVDFYHFLRCTWQRRRRLTDCLLRLHFPGRTRYRMLAAPAQQLPCHFKKFVEAMH